jgi:hypothetical protein
MRIRNKTKFTLCVSAREFTGAVARGDTLTDVPDDVATDWAARKTPAAFIASGLVELLPDETQAAPTEWRDAVAAVGKIESLDELEALHADELRPKVRTAIETRMKELRAG